MVWGALAIKPRSRRHCARRMDCIPEKTALDSTVPKGRKNSRNQVRQFNATIIHFAASSSHTLNHSKRRVKIWEMCTQKY